jgi:hypothetical protein
MKHVMRYLFLAAGLCAVRSEAVDHYYFKIFGASCVSITSGVKAEVNQWGVYNPSTTQGMDVTCPIVVASQNYTQAYLGIGGYNRSNSDALTCNLNMSNDDGYSLTQVHVAVRQQAGPGVVYASGYNFPTYGQHNAWVTCHVPSNPGTGWSYLTSLNITLDY